MPATPWRGPFARPVCSALLVLVPFLTLTLAPATARTAAAAEPDDAARLVAAVLADTPMLADLEALTDRIGGRATGSEANERAVEWAAERFRDAGVEVRVEPFEMPARWEERSAHATVEGDGVRFEPRMAAMPFSTATPAGGLAAPLVDAGRGGEEDFARLGDAARGAIVLVATDLLEDIPGLFREYAEAAAIEERAAAARVAGLVYMGSRPGNQLYRHNASRGAANELPLAVMERDGASRALRLLAGGTPLTLNLELDVARGGPYTSRNVVGEIRGGELPDEVVVIGAHLDSWELGDGALDNGCNVALVIDLARQMRRLGLVPRRTIRFALFNGEEQGLWGSRGYAETHAGELDRTVMASSYDIGSGRITGFFTGGRPEIAEVLGRALGPVAGLGPFENPDLPVVGTDNYDFMMEGVANLVANQESANYGPNYHARSDTFDKVDPVQLRLNAAIAAAVTWGFANDAIDWGRQSRAEVQQLIDSTDLGEQMKTFGLYESWESGERGRRE
jgi:hypothetical protein